MKKHIYLICDNYDVALDMLKVYFGDKLLSAGGFVSLREKNGVLSLYPSAAAITRGDYEGREFMNIESAIWHDTEAYRELGAQLLSEAEYYPFAVLAYIGGFELIIPQFRAELSELISSELPTVAIMLSKIKTEEIRQKLGLGDKLTAYSDRLRSAVAADGDSILISTDDCKCESIVKEWIKSYVS